MHKHKCEGVRTLGCEDAMPCHFNILEKSKIKS